MELLNEFDFSSPDFLESLGTGPRLGSAASSPSRAVPSSGGANYNTSPPVMEIEKLSLEDPNVPDNPGSALDLPSLTDRDDYELRNLSGLGAVQERSPAWHPAIPLLDTVDGHSIRERGRTETVRPSTIDPPFILSKSVILRARNDRSKYS